MKVATIFSFLLVGFCVASYAQCANEANVYSFSHNGTDYEIIKEMKNWTNASACAVERNGKLVEINDATEQSAVYNAISAAGISTTYITIANGGGIAYVWIGATDQTTEGTWIWDGANTGSGTNFWSGQGANGANDGAAVMGAYSNWGGTSTGTPNEPDNFGSGQDHAAIGLTGWPSGTSSLGSAGEWNDIIGTSSLYFIVELNADASVEEGSTEGVFLYPNPCSTTLTIDVPQSALAYTYAIYDQTGRLVQQAIMPPGNSVSVEELEAGIYFLKVSGDTVVTIQFTKE